MDWLLAVLLGLAVIGALGTLIIAWRLLREFHEAERRIIAAFNAILTGALTRPASVMIPPVDGPPSAPGRHHVGGTL